MDVTKRRDGIAEFDPESLADGLVYDDTYEAEFLEELPEDLCDAFIMYLEHLQKLKRWNIANHQYKVEFCAQRTEAELEDNRCLRNMLLQGEPDAIVPFGCDPMITEYWKRRGHDLKSLKAEYFEKQRAHAQIQEAKADTWLVDDGEQDMNSDKYAVMYGW